MNSLAGLCEASELTLAALPGYFIAPSLFDLGVGAV